MYLKCHARVLRSQNTEWEKKHNYFSSSFSMFQLSLKFWSYRLLPKWDKFKNDIVRTTFMNDSNFILSLFLQKLIGTYIIVCLFTHWKKWKLIITIELMKAVKLYLRRREICLKLKSLHPEGESAKFPLSWISSSFAVSSIHRGEADLKIQSPVYKTNPPWMHLVLSYLGNWAGWVYLLLAWVE